MKTNFFLYSRINFLVLAVVGLFLLSGVVKAQRGGVSASSNSKSSSKAKKKKESKREREMEKARKNFNWKQNTKRQKDDTVVLPMKYYGVSESLDELVKKGIPPVSKENGPLMEEKSEELLEEPIEPAKNLLPETIQTVGSSNFTATVGANFDAITAAGSAPPDTTLAVGPNHIIVWVNSRYAIYDKNGNLILGPVNGNTLFTGVGNVCETTNRGDPMLQYDRLADRWILSQFAFNVAGGNPTTPYLQCFAVSTTNDPTGTYVRYTVDFSNVNGLAEFNDYGKLGVWTDAYYSSYNAFQGSPAGSNNGALLCASDRTKMLAGDATAATLCAPVAFYGGGAAFLPADLDGTTLPTDTTQGGIFIRQSTVPALRLLKLKPDFTNSTVTLTDGFGGAAGSFINIPLPTTTRACNGSGGVCVAQPNTTNRLDTLADRLMYRAAYRNRGGTDSLIVVQSVDPDGAGTRSSAVRWYEIRNPFAAVPTLLQNSTFDEGSTGDRWMGSIAMNKDGDMMMGYSIVNSATGLKPSLAFTGRRFSDPVNTMQTEQIVFTGTGSQTGTLTRWGDYTTIQVDPADDQGFCFVGQYLQADGTFNWRTRVICAKFATPTAANAIVSGRVSTALGTGISRARVSITDTEGTTRTFLTNSFGYYSIPDVQVGQTYVITVAAKGQTFLPPNIVLQVNADLDELNFIAQ